MEDQFSVSNVARSENSRRKVSYFLPTHHSAFGLIERNRKAIMYCIPLSKRARSIRFFCIVINSICNHFWGRLVSSFTHQSEAYVLSHFYCPFFTQRADLRNIMCHFRKICFFQTTPTN